MAQANPATKNSNTSNKKEAAEKHSNHPVADRLKDSLHESVDALSDRAADAERGIRESAEKGTETYAERRRQVESKWNNSGVKQYAVENPVKTAGIAFAAGALLASIMRGK